MNTTLTHHQPSSNALRPDGATLAYACGVALMPYLLAGLLLAI